MKKKLLCTVLSLVFLLLLFVTPVSATPEEARGNYEYTLVDNVARIIENYYKFGTTREEMVSAALYRKLVHPNDTVEDLFDEMLSSLDPHSSYLYKDDFDYLINHTIEGEFVGIGVSIVQRSGNIIVVSAIKGSPAEAAGILPNDIIVSANGIDLSSASVDYAQSLITGEEGTVVTIGVLRGGKRLTFDIQRAKIKDTSVTFEIIDGVGYLSLSSFNGNTVAETQAALGVFDQNGIDKIIIDLRNNPGGELSAVVGFCNFFIPKGPVASVEYKDPSKNETFYSYLRHPKYQLAVLVNSGTASAAELFSAAVKDTKVGKLFGTTTYGKGTMQSLITYYPTGGGLRITVAEFFSAKGNKINEVGVAPDFPVTNKTYKKDLSNFVPVDFSSVYSEGSAGNGVLALEQRLAFLGYFDAVPDTIFDSETRSAVLLYQTYRDLDVTGTADFHTLFDLNNIEYENIDFLDDRQFDAAMEYIKGL